jgi:hypothetical protein
MTSSSLIYLLCAVAAFIGVVLSFMGMGKR